jgi:two-component sensor histidine kinase/PAS domain-containing protein
MQRWIHELGRRMASPTGLALTYFIFGLIWIFASDRVLESFVSNNASITALQTYKGWAYVSVTAALLYGLTVTLVARLSATRDRLRETRGNFRRLVEASHDGMWVVDREGRVIEANSRLARILGVDVAQLLTEGVDRLLLRDSLAPGGGPAPGSPQADEPPDGSGDSPDSRIVRFRRAAGETGWGIVTAVPLTDSDGRVTGELRILSDITRTKQAEAALRTSLLAERTLLNELEHRVRNNLASLLTLIELTRRGTENVGDFASLIRGRVGAMAATHSLLAESKFTSVELARLVSVITVGEQEHRLERHGPPITLAPSQAGPIAMILQELWTNSVKHGALGSAGGRVIVRWDLAEEPDGHLAVHLTWQDIGGPPVSPPMRTGFGLELMTGLSESDLRGQFSARFDPGGAVFLIRFPVMARHTSRAPAGDYAHAAE